MLSLSFFQWVGPFVLDHRLPAYFFTLKFLLLVPITHINPDARKSNPKVSAPKDLCCCLLEQWILMEENQCVGSGVSSI